MAAAGGGPSATTGDGVGAGTVEASGGFGLTVMLGARLGTVSTVEVLGRGGRTAPDAPAVRPTIIGLPESSEWNASYSVSFWGRIGGGMPSLHNSTTVY